MSLDSLVIYISNICDVTCSLGVFGCMFAALSTEFEQLCIPEMMEKNEYFNILMWAGLGLKLLLHVLVLLIKFGCPENILTPSYTKLGAIDLEEMDVIDTHSEGTVDDLDFEREPGRCRICFGRFVAFVGITLGVCGTLAIFVAFFVFVYGGFGIKGVDEVEISDLEKFWYDYKLLLSVPLLTLFIPSLMVVWCCLRAHSKSYHSTFNTNTIPSGCFNCCLRRSTAAFFLFVAAFAMILLPVGLVFAAVISGQQEITFREDVNVPGYLMGIGMAASIMLLSFCCFIPSCFYFLWNRGFRQGFSKSKESWFEDNDKKKFNEQVTDVRAKTKTRSHANVTPLFSVGPMESQSNIGRIDSFRNSMPGRPTSMEMSPHTNLSGIIAEESHSNIPIPPNRSPNQYQKLQPPKDDPIKDPNSFQHTPPLAENRHTMDTVYENESTEAMLSHEQRASTAPNAPPLPDSARESLSETGANQTEMYLN